MIHNNNMQIMLTGPKQQKNTGRLPWVVALLAIWFSASCYAVTVDNVRLRRAPDHTRLVFDVSGPVQHKILTLTKPHRLVIDIDDTQLDASFAQLSLANSPIERIRSARRDKTDLRVVLDLKEAVKPRSFTLRANQEFGNRLVVDLYDREQSSAPKVKKTVPDRSATRDIVIAIDAGHGGEDPGASGPNKVREKHVVLAIARQLETLINKEKGFKAVMVRTGDYYIKHAKRRAIARKANADLFVSIHADAFTDPRAYGASVFGLSRRGASSTMASFLANSANNSDLVGGVDLSDKDDVLVSVLTDLSLNASIDAGLNVGGQILHGMSKIARLHSKKVETANFAVLRSPDVPSILVETGFISNPKEEKKLNSKRYQKQMASAIFKGVVKHFKRFAPEGTYIASLKLPANPVSHTISRGDTLSAIAQRYRVSVAALRRENDLRGNTIRIGQTLRIPTS